MAIILININIFVVLIVIQISLVYLGYIHIKHITRLYDMKINKLRKIANANVQNTKVQNMGLTNMPYYEFNGKNPQIDGIIQIFILIMVDYVYVAALNVFPK